jgi:bis(5'-adenosyl)-triphosphatase
LTPHKRLTDLSPPEITDLFTTVQRVQRMLARHYFSQSSTSPRPSSPDDGSFNIALQDGAGAGQTVPHVHVHVIPRIRGSTAKETSPGGGDELYEKMANEEGNAGGALWDWERRPKPGGAFPRIEESSRQARSLEEMVEEAGIYRRLLSDMEGDDQ